MVLNPNVVIENIIEFTTNDEPLTFYDCMSHKETPEQYKARKESMAQRKNKKETSEEYESRKAYMKEKAIRTNRIKERKLEEYLKREELRKELREKREEEQRKKKEEAAQLEKDFGPIHKLSELQLSMQRHEEKLKRQTQAYERQKAYQQREERRKLGGTRYIDMPHEPKIRMSWNVEGN